MKRNSPLLFKAHLFKNTALRVFVKTRIKHLFHAIKNLRNLLIIRGFYSSIIITISKSIILIRFVKTKHKTSLTQEKQYIKYAPSIHYIYTIKNKQRKINKKNQVIKNSCPDECISNTELQPILNNCLTIIHV